MSGANYCVRMTGTQADGTENNEAEIVETTEALDGQMSILAAQMTDLSVLISETAGGFDAFDTSDNGLAQAKRTINARLRG